MTGIPKHLIDSYRAETFRTAPGRRLHSVEEAIDFVNERGFIFFWPISGIPFPSLWCAVAGDRPVADAHDDPGHMTWGWKDDLLGKRRWYYAKVLRKKGTMISLEVAPYFYALSENYGSPEEDYLTLYEQGRLTVEAKTVYEALLDRGPLDTVALRKATRMTSRESDSRFNRAMSDLQADFKILPVAVTQAGAWHYAFAYDIAARHFPGLPDQAQAIGENAARDRLAELALRSLGAARLADLTKLFGWAAQSTGRSLDRLAQSGLIHLHAAVEGQPGEWAVLCELAQ
jgi:hypothetical protein